MENKRIIKQSKINILTAYLNFRLGKYSPEQWLKNSAADLENMLKLDPAELEYVLMQAHLFLMANRREEVKQILSKFEKRESEIATSRPFLYAYYVYLKCLFFKDKTMQQQGAAIVIQIADKFPRDWRIQWFRLYLDENCIKDKLLRLDILRQQYKLGCISPAIYYEACVVINENPAALRQLDGMELQAIHWGVRNNFIKKELAVKVILSALRIDVYSPILLKVLIELYKSFPEKELIRAICHVLIQGDCKDARANAWYTKGVEEQLRINELSEYYLSSRERDDYSPLPQAIVRYFVYNSSIDEEDKKYLYVSVIKNEESAVGLMDTYVKQILIFAEEQLEKRTIDRQLAIIYLYILETQKVDRTFIERFIDIAFKNRIQCKAPNIVNVTVKHRELKEEEIAQISSKQDAYVDIYSGDYSIAFTDGRNERHTQGIEYTMTKMFEDVSYLKQAYDRGIKNDKLLIYMSYVALSEKVMNSEVIILLEDTLQIKKISKDFASEIAVVLFEEYAKQAQTDKIKHVIEYIDLQLLSKEDIFKVIETYISLSLIDEAIKQIEVYGYEGLSIESLYSLCEIMLEKGLDSPIVLSICESLFEQNKENERILEYLVKQFDNTLDKMHSLWARAYAAGVDTTSLAERMLNQMVMVEDIDAKYMDVFKNYAKNNVFSPVMEQFLKFTSSAYLQDNIVIPEEVFDILRKKLEYGEESRTSEYALLKWYSLKPKLADEEKVWVEKIGQKLYSEKRMVSWFKKFDSKVVLPTGLKERTYIEYIASPNAKVEFFYRYDWEDSFNSREMKQIGDGLFVVDVLLFYNENLQYYIEETENGESKITISERYTIDEEEEIDIDSNSSYSLINAMLVARKHEDIDRLDNILNEYIDASDKISTYFKPFK